MQIIRYIDDMVGFINHNLKDGEVAQYEQTDTAKAYIDIISQYVNICDERFEREDCHFHWIGGRIYIKRFLRDKSL